jgi:hypothetical protein
MAKREIDDTEYAFLQSRKQVADFVETIYNDPALSAEAKRLIKKKYPDMQIPDLDIEDKLTKRLDDDKREREEAERRRREEAEDQRYKETRSKTQKEYGLTDEGMQDLEKFMLERNIGDYDVAASYRVAKQPKPSDADADAGRDHFWDHSKQDGFADISADPEKWARKEILSAIRKDTERNRGGSF